MITQLFFDVREYLHFVDRLSDMGVSVPVIPGILPIQSLESIRRTLSLCGANIPGKLYLALRKPMPRAARKPYAKRASSLPCSRSAPCWTTARRGIHLYTLNKAPMCLRIAEEVGAL